MNKKEQYVAAIDIGTTKIVAIVGKKNENGKIEILGLSKALSKGVKRGVVLNIEETVNAIQTTVEDVQKRSGILFSEVFVGIAGQHIKSMKNRGYIMREAYDDEIQKEEVFKLIEDMHKIHIDIGEEIIHVIPQNFIVDNETGVKSPIGMCGRRLEANFLLRSVRGSGRQQQHARVAAGVESVRVARKWHLSVAIARKDGRCEGRSPIERQTCDLGPIRVRHPTAGRGQDRPARRRRRPCARDEFDRFGE